MLVPEGRHVFPNITVEENLILGAYTIDNKKDIRKNMNEVYDIFPRLKERHWQKAGTLSGRRAADAGCRKGFNG